ncbi:unnamed protein product [Vitrella brassicaformis CCMP3155]|uniref:RING-type domain-containing protein n=2 Tax=Vitrella brassicaformis TaxID=1169539 RepID=A0A0G4G229_VITBC|nr:unnamed protein product [Vitrella brassicaformis CCMP3155]|eukprot:CEM22127.1 unnamed protein product [Vitrella brassicaformis CCMP3155]
MGYREGIFQCSDSGVLRQFLCAVCLDVVSDPVITSCQHIFCADCFRGDKCPSCRHARVTIKPLNDAVPALYRMLSNLSVVCPNAGDGMHPGCLPSPASDTQPSPDLSDQPSSSSPTSRQQQQQQQQQRSKKKRKGNGGDNVTLPPLLSGDGEEGGRGAVGCAWRGTYADLERHLGLHCPARWVECDICGEQVIAAHLPEHNVSQAASHVALLQTRLQALQPVDRQISSLRRWLESTEPCCCCEEAAERIDVLGRKLAGLEEVQEQLRDIQEKVDSVTEHQRSAQERTRRPFTWECRLQRAAEVLRECGVGEQINTPSFAVMGHDGFKIRITPKCKTGYVGVYLQPPAGMSAKLKYRLIVGSSGMVKCTRHCHIFTRDDTLAGKAWGCGTFCSAQCLQQLLLDADGSLRIAVEVTSVQLIEAMRSARGTEVQFTMPLPLTHSTPT